MKNKLFDEQVKKQFDGYRPEVAPHIWKNIVSAKNTNKPAPFFTGSRMIAALCILIISIAVFYFAGSNDNSLAENIKTAAEKNTIEEKRITGSGKTGVLPEDYNTGSSANTGPAAQRGNDNSNKTISKKQQKEDISQKMLLAVNAGTVDYIDNKNSAVTPREKYLKTNFVDLYLLRNVVSKQAKLKMPTLPQPKDIPCPEIEKNTAGNKTYFEIYAGPDYIFRSFSDTSGSAYLQQRKGTGSMLFAFSTGLRYTKVFGNGISIRTGLNYSQFNERFKYAKGNVIHNVYITNTSGDTTGTFTETGTQYQSGTNIYRTLDIPVAIGYEMGNGRFHTNVNAGAMINIRSRQSGYILDPAGTPVNISSGKQAGIYGFRTNIGVSFLGGVSFYYKLNDRFHLMGEPYFRYCLSPMTKSDISLKQKNHTAGVRIGLRMDLK